MIVLICSRDYTDECKAGYPQGNNFFFYATVFLDTTSFVSQVLLCVILWDLGTKEQEGEDMPRKKSIKTISVKTVSFDGELML